MSVYQEITAEREAQVARFGNEMDRVVNTPNDFVAYISHYASRWFKGGFQPYPTEMVNDYRQQMIKVAALAVAAVEALDYQRDNLGTAHFEAAS